MENSRLVKTAFLCLILMLFSSQSVLSAHADQSQKEVQVGVILDMGSWVGKVVNRSINMAISDFYAANSHYKTRIVLSTRDTKGEPLLTLSTALDLLENTEVKAIIGPDSTVESRLLEVLEEKANIPILSFSSSPFSNQNPYLLQIAEDETIQFEGIATMMDSFKWMHVILICEDTVNGREMATYMVSEFHKKNIHVTYTSFISTSAFKKQILQELRKLQNMQTTMFVIHTSPSLSSNVFLIAKEVGMMDEGYMWIVTSKTTNFLNFMDVDTIESMQGALGFKSYFPKSRKFSNFVSKWRKEHSDLNPFMEFKAVDCNGIWAYDVVYALAMAVEKLQTTFTGTSLLNHISSISFHGLAGEFKLKKGKTISKAVEIINMIGRGDRRIGFWEVNGKFVKEIGKKNLSSNSGLQNVIWPGGTITIPNRRRLQINGKKLRIIVPVFDAYPNLIQMNLDPTSNLPTVSGFCGDVFNVAFNALNYGVEIEFIPYPYEYGRNYNDLIDKVYLKEFDAAVGDITITSNRSRYVDFTLPFSDLGIGTLERNSKKSMWIFLNPLSANLWFTSAGFFLFLGFVIWFIEHRINEEFQGSTRQQIGTTLWFAFSTLVYAHREKLQSNLSRFVVTVWVFVVLVLTSSYTATLSSLLTVQQIASNEGSVRSRDITTVGFIYKKVGFSYGINGQLGKPEYSVEALRSGSVGAITDEILYIKSVLALYSAVDFSLVATASNTNGFGFVFQKGSPLTIEMSSEIAKMREDGTLKALENKWLKRQSSMMSKDLSSPAPDSLTLHGLRGLFLISGVSMALALLVSLVYLILEKCHGKSKMDVLRCILQTSHHVHAQDNDVDPPV